MTSDTPVNAALRAHLAERGLSSRALSLEAGLGENDVGYLLSGPARPAPARGAREALRRARP